MIILAILLPPVAVFLATRGIGRTLIALVLWICGWIPGSIYGVITINEAKSKKLIKQSEERIIAAQRESAAAAATAAANAAKAAASASAANAQRERNS